ncbi:TonB-dependent receptor domain-containing protein [Parasediminibacterium paludis]|uniref:TonB-dependent receptor domain-containing protein n=1 Tax=Parasediminibacterium paludis TaxID=908966 RepID=A0ABV8PRT2_9BACT
MKKFFLLGILLASTFISQAQYPSAGKPAGATGRGGGQNVNIGHLYGKIVDKQTNKGIPGVSVQLTGNRFDTITKQMKQAVLKTVITEANGDFSLEGISIFGNFKMKLSAVGYKAAENIVSFGIKFPAAGSQPDFAAIAAAADKDLGNIKLEQDATQLESVTVTSTAKPLFELGIDRKVFNVDKNLVSTGQTATEIMKSIPSLSVDIDGNVTLRNASPTIFVDGRPTTLTLDQIPADLIEKVEIITNPSAKYDASGGGAGILNIVLKKNKKVGYNGGIRAGVDSRGKFNGGGDLNLRQNKVNFFLSGVYNQRKSISTNTTDRNDFGTKPDQISQNQKSTNEGYFGFLRGGLDYFVDNRNTVSIAANFNRGQFNGDQEQQVDSTSGGIYKSYNSIVSNSVSNFKNFGSSLSFKHNFEKNGHNISADLNYNYSTNNNNSLINTQNYYPYTITPTKAPIKQQTLGSGENKFLTAQVDYENPITENTKLELGGRAALRDFSNLNNQYFYNSSTGFYDYFPLLSSNYKYTDAVYAAYANISWKANRFSYQLGLRAESSDYKGNILSATSSKDSSFRVSFPISLFPSAFITYKLTDKQDLQLNYSRRINRPNFFQLIPFIDYTDPLNLSNGNANLKPEFTNSFEVSYNNAYKKGANLLVTAYFKQTDNLITRYQYKDKNPAPQLTTADSVVFNTYINANSSIAYGLEVTNKLPVTKFWDLTLNVNLFNSKINSTNVGNGSNNEQVSWFGKMNNSFKFKKGVSIQFSGDYSSKSVLSQGGGGGGSRGGGGGGFYGGGGSSATAQGYNFPRYSFDIALRKDWTWKNGQSGSLTLSMNDMFRTQISKTYSESIYFNQISERRRDPQVLRINFSYRFGKFDATLFKRKNTKADQSGGTEMIGQGN